MKIHHTSSFFFYWASGSISLGLEVNPCAVVVVPSRQRVLSFSSLAVVYNCVVPGWNGRERSRWSEPEMSAGFHHRNNPSLCKQGSAPLANGQRLRLAALQSMLTIIQSKANKTRGKTVNVVFAVSSCSVNLCQCQWWRKQHSWLRAAQQHFNVVSELFFFSANWISSNLNVPLETKHVFNGGAFVPIIGYI